jgi:hypothetical protein
MSSSMDNIRMLIEALRGGSNPQQAQDNELSTRSSMNPQGCLTRMVGRCHRSPSDPAGSYTKDGGFSSAGVKDPQYLDYVKKTKNPMPYMDWLEKG